MKCPVCSQIHNLITFFVILLILSSTHARFIPQGNLNSKPNDNQSQIMENGDGHNQKMELRNEKIGSRPPICEWKKYCKWCAKCQPIQVPIANNKKDPNTRRDVISNYKPMSWKCKCGDFTFNP